MSDWYERAVKDEYIKSFEYESFKNWKHIGKGGFGTVYSAYSEDIDQTIALKSLNDNLIDENKFYEFVREVRNIIKVHHHINIIQFFGFTKDTTTENGTSYMVLQFANNGDLRSYLLDHFSELNWSSKIEMAKDISNGIKCLHKANIVHRDLHDKNILVDNGRLMIADFGLSKSLGSTSNSFAGGTILYSDPKYMENPYKFKREKPSDIYSLGVLFWELSSGVPPFKNMTGETSVAIKIISGKREDPINGTPIDFMNLYCDAWNGDPNSRPNIAEICNKINTIQLFPVYNSIKPTLVESNPAIERESINSFEFKSFKNVEHIGKGGFGDIVSADSEDMGQTVALKCYTKASYNDIVREVKIITKVHHHANIIRFFGITKNPETEKYYMVLQFANNGNLRRYLRDHFLELKWSTQIKMAKDISNGIKCLHKANIVHCDLHTGNILVNNGNLIITDFGLSRLEMTDESISRGGVMPYIAPEILRGEQYTKAADIYSFGVIMSEISNGQMPFYNYEFNVKLAVKVIKGQLRPEFASGTPDCYIELANQCMDLDPQKRPIADDIRDVLEKWNKSIEGSYGNNEIKKQFLEADKFIKILPSKFSDEIYTSKLISTKLISKNIEYYSDD